MRPRIPGLLALSRLSAHSLPADALSFPSDLILSRSGHRFVRIQHLPLKLLLLHETAGQHLGVCCCESFGLNLSRGGDTLGWTSVALRRSKAMAPSQAQGLLA